MRIAVFGGTGRTGVPVVQQALERGHEVRALARSAAKAAAVLPAGGTALTTVEGDLLDPAAVAEVVAGTDVVVQVAGPGRGSPSDLQQRAIAAVLAGMREHGVRRLVTLTGAGVRIPEDRPKLADTLIVRVMQLAAGKVLADSGASVDAVRTSDRDWTVVRAPRLTEGTARGNWRVAPIVGPDSGTQLARADLATFLLDTAESDAHLHAFPVVSY